MISTRDRRAAAVRVARGEEEGKVPRERASPRTMPSRAGVALCLSGGGFRAALFHLGALRRLNELGILAQLATISAVSGGSIVAAHLAERLRPWPAPGEAVPAAAWERRVAAPFRAFAARNHRTGPLARRLLPGTWPRLGAPVAALEGHYRRLIRGSLADLPERPRFVFCATDLAHGVAWVFERRRVGSYRAGYLRPAPAWPLARAVAASSCFPPLFPPLELAIPAGRLRGGTPPAGVPRPGRIRLTDGGVYDNLGLEPAWRAHATVLVSDGGGVFDAEADPTPLARLLRYTTILDNQVRALRKRQLMGGFADGTIAEAYWRIGRGATEAGGYSEAFAGEVLARIRTDLDAFAAAEIAALENHGYLVAEAALRRRVPALIANPGAPLVLPHAAPRWADERRLREALAGGHARRLLGRW